MQRLQNFVIEISKPGNKKQNDVKPVREGCSDVQNVARKNLDYPENCDVKQRDLQTKKNWANDESGNETKSL